MVYLTNTYCMLRKARKWWLQDCSSAEIKQNIDKAGGYGTKLCVEIMA